VLGQAQELGYGGIDQKISNCSPRREREGMTFGEWQAFQG
jgi:hypothetical protein